MKNIEQSSDLTENLQFSVCFFLKKIVRFIFLNDYCVWHSTMLL